MELTSGEKITKIIEYYGITIKELERKISTSNGQLAKVKDRNSALKDEILDKILTIFPEINAYWLITGRGNMIFSELNDKKSTTVQPPVKQDPTIRELQAVCDEKERTIQVLQDTNRNLLAEIQQLRAYVNTTSTKYIQIVEQTLEAARQTNATVQQLQASIGFHHNDSNHHRIAAHHPNDQDPK